MIDKFLSKIKNLVNRDPAQYPSGLNSALNCKVFKAALKDIEKNKLKPLQEKIAANPDLAKFTIIKTTLLQEAAKNNRLEMVKLLLEAGAHPNMGDDYGYRDTPLSWAVIHRNNEMIASLLKAGVDIDAADRDGRTAIWHADDERFFILVGHGAQVSEPLAYLRRAACGSIRITEYILDNVLETFPVDDPPKPFKSPMESEELAENLFEILKGNVWGLPKMSDEDLRKIAQSAIEEKHNPVDPKLKWSHLEDGLTKDLLMEKCGSRGSTDLDQAALSTAVWPGDQNNEEIIKLLLSRGAARGNQGRDGRVALLRAMERDRPQYAKLIYEALADQEQKARDQANQPQPDELMALARTMGEDAINRKDFKANPDELLKTMAEALTSYPRSCLTLLQNDLDTRHRLAVSVISQFNAEQAARPGYFENRLQNVIESGSDAQPNEPMEDAFLGDIFEQLNEDRENDIDELVTAGSAAQKENRPLKEVLRDIDQELMKLDPRISRLFQPGLTAEELARLTKNRAHPFSDDLLELYKWHNGLIEYDSLCLFQDYIFLPIQQALITNHDMIGNGLMPDYLFEIMNDGSGNYLAVDLRPEADRRGLLINIYHDEPSIIVFPGLNAYFGAVLAGLRRNIFKVVASGGPMGEDILATDFDRIYQHFNRFSLNFPGEAPGLEFDEDDDSSNSTVGYETILPDQD